MDGLYLSSNLKPLESIGEGKALKCLGDVFKSDRFQDVEMVAYLITGPETRIPDIDILFKHRERSTLYTRRFTYYKFRGKLEDDLKLTADHGIGIADFDVDNFLKLREFYLKNKEAIA
jgi:hypothetical protein